MKFHGRVTIYGEYLADLTDVLCLPTKSYSSTKIFEDNLTNTYNRKLDMVATFFSGRGLKSADLIYSNIVYEYGLSSSTVLALLHAYTNTNDFEEIKKIVNESDKIFHGFDPSGMDFYSVYHSSAGLYRANKWCGVKIMPFYSLFIQLPKEHKIALDVVQNTILDKPQGLIEISNQLTQKITTSGKLDLKLLLAYCRELAIKNVYSESAKKLISQLLETNVAAKGVGGLYDKLILVTGESESEIAIAKNLAREFKCRIYDSPIMFSEE